MDVADTFPKEFIHIVEYPDAQAHYVKQGKWIDYLAERVPVYEKYQKAI